MGEKGKWYSVAARHNKLWQSQSKQKQAEAEAEAEAL